MPRGGNGGGGGKPDNGNGGGGTGTDGVSWKGSRGDNVLKFYDDGEADGANAYDASEFATGTFDGNRGSDTLDFSNLTSDGIFVELIGSDKFQRSNISLESAWNGLAWGNPRYPSLGLVTENVIGFESVIGTQGNDQISAYATGSNFIYGLGGNDYLGGATTVAGGSGSDHISGGTYVFGGDFLGTYAPQSGDGFSDTFERGTILDFEIGLDKINVGVGAAVGYIEDFFAQGFVEEMWTSPDGGTYVSAVLYNPLRGDEVLRLVGIDADTANSLIMPEIGFSVSGFDINPSPVTGALGDDIFTLRQNSNVVLFEIDAGNDTLVYSPGSLESGSETPEDDILVFPEDMVPDFADWHFEDVGGTPVWTYTFNGGTQTATVIGLDAEQMAALTFTDTFA